MWFTITRKGDLIKEYNDDGTPNGRPVDAGNNGELLVVGEEDFGHKVAVDLENGVIIVDFDSIGIQNGTLEIAGPRSIFHICDETNVIGEFRHIKQEFVPFKENGKYVRDENKRKVMVRNDILTPLAWRPIWFTRYTNGNPTKVIGAQVTMPETQGGHNKKKLVSIFSDGRLGID